MVGWRWRAGSMAALAALAALTAAAPLAAARHRPADLVVLDARIYQPGGAADATALAVTGGRLQYVGDEAGARAYIGDSTRVRRLAWNRVLPGLVDAHLHPLDIAELDVCDLNSRPRSLRQLAAFVRGCLEHYRPPAGGRLVVHQWSYAGDNRPDAEYPTLRAALDRASTEVELQLLGDDAHHGAFNSLALAHARNARGQVVGLTRATLAGDFAGMAKLIGVDADGEPNGAVNDDARYTINPHSMLYTDLAAVAEAPEQIPRRLNSVGITAMLDAMASPEGVPIYEQLLKNGQLTVRTTLALFLDPARYQRADGHVDFEAMLQEAGALRARFAGNPLLKADTVKLFADGGLEGNPYAVPPTLPNAAVLEPYRQPIFGVDADGRATVAGYVNTGSELCAQVRAEPAAYEPPAAVRAFMVAHGYHPAQCTISSGQLQHPREVILEFARRFHLAGFNLHIHVIGDRATRTALDAIELARAADGVRTTRDALAHVQLATRKDMRRIGRDRLYVAYTYGWISTDRDYDTMVVPFVQAVDGVGWRQLHAPRSYYEQHVYPVAATRDAGAILVAGSDVPVSGRDPHPFVHMAAAISRRAAAGHALNAAQAITIREVLDAYTLNGARLLGLEAEIGSLEAGKSADFVILDRDPLALGEAGELAGLAATRVLETWLSGVLVYRAGAGAARRHAH